MRREGSIPRNSLKHKREAHGAAQGGTVRGASGTSSLCRQSDRATACEHDCGANVKGWLQASTRRQTTHPTVTVGYGGVLPSAQDITLLHVEDLGTKRNITQFLLILRVAGRGELSRAGLELVKGQASAAKCQPITPVSNRCQGSNFRLPARG